MGEALELKRGEETNNGRIPPSPLPPLPPGNPIASASSPTAVSSPLILYKKRNKTRDLSSCHNCGLRVPSEGPPDQLRTLRSQWRIVLLCKGCLAAVASAEACSYCFSKIFRDKEQGSLVCHECRHRVHRGCLPRQHPYLPPLRLDQDPFACIDCCPILKPRDHAASRVSSEDTARDVAEVKVAAAARAKVHPLARRAAELARNPLDAVLPVKDPTTANAEEVVVPDEELALQLHLAMNGSHRISRTLISRSSDCLVGLKKVKCGGEPVGWDAESESYGICVKSEVCAKDKFFIDAIERNGFPQDMHLNMAVKEEQGSCSERVANSGGGGNSISSASMSCRGLDESIGSLHPERCARGFGQDSDDSQRKEMGGAPDRYRKKYSKRHWRLGGMKDTKECQIAPCRQVSCSEPEVSKSCSHAPHQPPRIPVHPSTCTSDLSGCQS